MVYKHNNMMLKTNIQFLPFVKNLSMKKFAYKLNIQNEEFENYKPTTELKRS